METPCAMVAFVLRGPGDLEFLRLARARHLSRHRGRADRTASGGRRSVAKAGMTAGSRALVAERAVWCPRRLGRAGVRLAEVWASA